MKNYTHRIPSLSVVRLKLGEISGRGHRALDEAKPEIK